MIYVEWRCSGTVDQAVLDTVDQARDQNDQTFCSSPGDDDPTILLLSFDLVSDSHDDAAAEGQRQVELFARTTSLTGTLVSVTAMDEEGQLRITP